MTAIEESAGLPRLQHDRQHAIYMLALSQGSVDVADLARRYEVSTETIRRDLSDMQTRNLLRRVHGGAVPVERINHEPMLAARDVVNAEEKLRIATKAVEEVPERGSVIIDSGSTTQRLAEVFPVDRDVHVVTNSLMTALTLSRRGLRQLTVLGGAVRTNTLAMVDDTTRSELQHMAIDVLFVSCDGLSFQHGLTTPYREEHTIKRAMIESARRVVAMVDQSKFGNVQMFSFAAFDEIDVLVTDTRADPEVVAGAVVDVLRDEVFGAHRGGGARCGGRPIAVSSCSSLPQALVTTGFSYRAELREIQGEVAHRLLSRARDLRCFGSTALELCWVACGRVDGYFQRDTEIWDRAAGALIAEEAGACVEMPCPENDDLVIAAGAAVFEDLRAAVQPAAA